MSGIEDEKLPPGAADFKFPKDPSAEDEAGLLNNGPDRPLAETAKYQIGQPYEINWWGSADEFNYEYLEAKQLGWIDENNALTKEGVEELERAGAEKKSSSHLDRLAASRAGHKSRIAERPTFSTSHYARKPAEPPVTNSVDRLETVQRKIAAMGEKEKNRPETEEEVLELFDDAVKSQGFNVIEGTVKNTGTSPLGKALYSFDVTISRVGRKGKNEPMHKFYEGSKESILMAIGKLR